MMRYSHRHARCLWRFLCPPVRLYTEMISTEAVLNGDTARLLTLPQGQSPVALQLGGAKPAALARAAAIGESFGYDEININCGCPSSRVKKGDFGASLMATPARVADIVIAIKNAVSLPVTVKCRTAIDDVDADKFLGRFRRRRYRRRRRWFDCSRQTSVVIRFESGTKPQCAAFRL